MSEPTQHITELENRLRALWDKYDGDCKHYMERIQRLEEAGDNLEYASVISEAGEDPNGFEKLLIAQLEWIKAKEDKP